MIQLVIIIIILAIAVFAWMKNKSDNRRAERHNRMLEKQEELLELLKNKKEYNDN
jgi:type II secretory pathway pseudopilin PulG